MFINAVEDTAGRQDKKYIWCGTSNLKYKIPGEEIAAAVWVKQVKCVAVVLMEQEL